MKEGGEGNEMGWTEQRRLDKSGRLSALLIMLYHFSAMKHLKLSNKQLICNCQGLEEALKF